MADDYTPRYVGDTSCELLHTFVDHAGTPFNIVGLDTSKMVLTFAPYLGGVSRAGKGTWLIVDGSLGQASYAWDEDDVAEAGLFNIQATLPFVGGDKHFEIKQIEFLTPL